MSRTTTKLGDLYSVTPWLDWVVAAGLTVILSALRVTQVPDLYPTAAAVSTLSGIFAAVAVFACSAAFQSNSLVLRIARAALPRAMLRSWVSIILGFMTAAAAPVAAMFLGAQLRPMAEALVLGGAMLNVCLIVRVGWWIRFIARSQEIDQEPAPQAQAPDWMHSEKS